jgi:hypothetical protein
MAVDIDRDTLDQLIAELDAKGRQQHLGENSEEYWVCQRRHPRYAFRADCTVRYLTGAWDEVMVTKGRTRNLSRGGLGLLVKHVFCVGDSVEVELTLPNQPVMFMAGVVQFIRYAGRGYHEMGVALKSAGREPIFTKDPEAASQSLGWLKRPSQAENPK